jgi:hypothetical protein
LLPELLAIPLRDGVNVPSCVPTQNNLKQARNRSMPMAEEDRLRRSLTFLAATQPNEPIKLQESTAENAICLPWAFSWKRL